MRSPDETLYLNLNQNLWGLLLSFTGLGGAEYYHLNTLYWITLVISIIMALSVSVTTLAYTVNYWKSKLK